MLKNPLIAQHVKQARLNKKASLRLVAYIISWLHPSLNIKTINYADYFTTGDQLEGYLLCLVAEEILNEPILNEK